jgi:hypothetical protein
LRNYLRISRGKIVKSLISISLLGLLFVAGATCAQSQAPQFPCEEDERFAHFDFWVGEWDVHVADGTYAGSNSITSDYRKCVLVEDYSTPKGFVGMSVNYLDHRTGEWVQVWNDASGSQINIRGGLTDAGMRLVGTIHYVGNNSTLPFRGTWTLLEDGRVRQFFEQYNEETEAWDTWFEGFYTRKPDAASAKED